MMRKMVPNESKSAFTCSAVRFLFKAPEKEIRHLNCFYMRITFTFMHLADAFIQSDLHCIQGTVSTFYQLLLSLGIEPMILALLAPCSTSWGTGKHYISVPKPSELNRTHSKWYGTLIKYQLNRGVTIHLYGSFKCLTIWCIDAQRKKSADFYTFLYLLKQSLRRVHLCYLRRQLTRLWNTAYTFFTSLSDFSDSYSTPPPFFPIIPSHQYE